MLQGCSADQILVWNASSSKWECKTIGVVGGVGDITAVGNITTGEAFTSGTPGSSLFFADTGFLGLGSAAGRIIFVDAGTDIISFINADVGIGTTNPGYKLDVAGSIRAGTEIYKGSIGLGDTGAGVSGATVIGTFDEFTNSDSINVQDVLDDLDAAIGTAASDAITAVGNITSGSAFTSTVPGSSLFFADTGFLGLGAATARISFDDEGTDEIELLGGNVGIGSTTPTALLSVGSENQLTVDGSGNLFTLGTGSFIGALSAPTINTGLGAFEIRLATDTLTGLAAFTAPHFTVSGAGMVSIATNAITATELASTTVTAGSYGGVLSGTSGFYPTFTVDADGRLTAASTVPFTFESPLSFSNGLTRSTNAVTLGGQITGDTRLYTGSGTGGTEVFFIEQSTGEIGIGTTNPGYKLDVAGSIRAGTEIYKGSIGLGDTGAGVSGATVIGTFDEFTNSDSINVQDVLDDLDAAIGTAASDAITAVGNITSGSAFTSTVPGSSLFFADTGFLGLGAATARISFDDEGTDEIELLGGNVGIGSTTPTALLSVGSENQLTVDGSGNLFTLGTGSFIGALSAPTINTGLGAFEIRLATDTLTGLAAFTAPHFTVSGAGMVSIATNAITATELASTTVTAGSYGGVLSGTSGFYPTFTVDADGRLTAASTVPFTFESPLSFSN